MKTRTSHPDDAKVTQFFIDLGYDMSWDASFRDGVEWHEISRDGSLVAQIDTGIPLAHIIEDLIQMATDKPGTSASDYSISAEDDKTFKTLCRAVKRAAKKS